jgi:hypothetical protein
MVVIFFTSQQKARTKWVKKQQYIESKIHDSFTYVAHLRILRYAGFEP